MNALLSILLLFTASRSASAVCLASCNYTLPCSEVYSCQIDICPNLTEEDLRDNCKCYVKCRREFEDLNKRKDNCLLLQRLKTCFEDGGCDVSNVPQLQKFAKECNNCEPKQCKEEACVGRLDCLTNSTRGGCTTAASVQSVMNTTSETMHNAWFLPEKCGCISKCASTALTFVHSCMGYETILKCASEQSCTVSKEKMNLKPCDCEFACSSEIDRTMKATNVKDKCAAKSDYIKCAKVYGCNQMPVKLKKIICETPGNDSSFFGSKILLTITIVFTILFAFITTNVIMA